MTVYNVVWIGDVYDTVARPTHDIESFTSRAKARARVAEYFRNVGHQDWRAMIRGCMWYNEFSGLYISIDECELN